MGEYEPEDSRDVTQNKADNPGGLERTGPREDQARRQSQSQEQAARRDGSQRQADEGKAQGGYGNARNEQGRMEQDVATDTVKQKEQADRQSDAQAQPGEVSPRPDQRAKADGNRPLGGD